MKAIIPILLCFSPLILTAEEPVNLLKKKVSYSNENITVAELFKAISVTMEIPPNFVFKGNAGDQMVSGLNLRNVSLGNLFKVVESVANIEIEVIDETNTANQRANDDPFADNSDYITPVLTSSGIVVISGKAVLAKRVGAFGGDFGGAGGFGSKQFTKKKTPLETDVISLEGLTVEPEKVIEVMRSAWARVDSEPSPQRHLIHHKELNLLLLTASAKEIEIAKKLMAALSPAAATEQKLRKKIAELEADLKKKWAPKPSAARSRLIPLSPRKPRPGQKPAERLLGR